MSASIDVALRTWGPRVAEAALGFEARWTVRALRRHNPELAATFEGVIERYRHAMVGGTPGEIEAEASLMCRAYAAVSTELVSAKVPNDAYQIGRDSKSGMTIAIGEAPTQAALVQELHGPGVAWFSPDEIATMIALNDKLNKIAQVKARFPGAEISDVREIEVREIEDGD